VWYVDVWDLRGVESAGSHSIAPESIRFATGRTDTNCSAVTATGKCTASDGVQHNPGSGVLLPEFEIVTEPEPEVLEQTTEERSEEERMEDYFKLVKSGKCGTVTDNDGGKSWKLGKTPEKATSDARSDKYFNAFKKRVALEPEQVEQYSSNEKPMASFHSSFSFGKIIHKPVYPQGFPRTLQHAVCACAV